MERQQQKQRDAAMDSRVRAETRMPSEDGVADSAREAATSQRQHEENIEANMRRRAYGSS